MARPIAADSIVVEYGGVEYHRRPNRPYYQDAGKSWLHRRVYEDTYGPIPPGWHVHHIDEDKDNNHPGNLAAISPEDHARLHWGERQRWALRCVRCGSDFESLQPWARWCSPRCKTAQRRDDGKVPPRPRVAASSFRCEHCDAPFSSHKPWARFCSPACKQRALRRRRRGLEPLRGGDA